MRIDRRKVITVELSREEAIALRRALDGLLKRDDEDAMRVAQELFTGLGQNLYETRENYA